jgi:hypothetical protein
VADSGYLLRMLEPAVRPVATPGVAAPRPQSAPFEAQNFDALLEEARAMEPAVMDSKVIDSPPVEAEKTVALNMLRPLSDIDAIANASLRNLIQQAGAGGSMVQSK